MHSGPGPSCLNFLQSKKNLKVYFSVLFDIQKYDFVFPDNYVYAWGNGENGRLGTGQMDLGKGPNNKSISIPRPIFGALHIVPHLSARHWHTILIAGKLVESSV